MPRGYDGKYVPLCLTLIGMSWIREFDQPHLSFLLRYDTRSNANNQSA